MNRRSRIAVLADDGDLRVSARRRLGELDAQIGNIAHIREHPNLGLSRLSLDHRLEETVDRELHVALIIGKRGIVRHIAAGICRPSREALQVARNELEASAHIFDRQGPGEPNRWVLRSFLGVPEIDRREQRTIRALCQLIAFRRLDGVDPLRPTHIVDLCQSPRAIEDSVVLEHHVADRDTALRDERNVAVGPPDRKQTRQTVVDMRRRQPMQMTVIPVGALRHVLRDMVRVRVRHPGRDVQHDIVGVALGADVHAMNVQVDRRRGHHRGIERRILALRRVPRIEEILDHEALKRVLEMDDQRLARKYLQCRRGI